MGFVYGQSMRIDCIKFPILAKNMVVAVVVGEVVLADIC